MASTVDAIKKKIIEQGGSISGVHTIPEAIERLDLDNNGEKVEISYIAENESINFKTR